jgi:hypothetical protein
LLEVIELYKLLEFEVKVLMKAENQLKKNNSALNKGVFDAKMQTRQD